MSLKDKEPKLDVSTDKPTFSDDLGLVLGADRDSSNQELFSVHISGWREKKTA